MEFRRGRFGGGGWERGYLVGVWLCIIILARKRVGRWIFGGGSRGEVRVIYRGGGVRVGWMLGGNWGVVSL